MLNACPARTGLHAGPCDRSKCITFSGVKLPSDTRPAGLRAPFSDRRIFCAAALALLARPVLGFAQGEEPKPPFVTTPQEVVARMLQLARVAAGDRVFDLGSGDGRIVIAAAKDFGAQATGIELDEGLVRKSQEAARAAGLEKRTRFIHGDVLRADISSATVVTVYLLPWLLERLQPRFLGQLRPGTRVVSHAFLMPGWLPDTAETVTLTRPHEGQGGSSRIFLWQVPAQVRGRWQADRIPGSEEWQITVAQNYQNVEIEARLGGKFIPVERASLSGRMLEFQAGRRIYRGECEGERIVGSLQGAGISVPLAFTRLK